MLSFFLLLFFTGSANAAMEDSLRKFVRDIDAFNQAFPQEKVYLHFDNTGYFQGETMWFKAYVMKSGFTEDNVQSRVLYVELINPSGDVIATDKLCIENGRAAGAIRLDGLLTSGFYEVIAYTRYMLNQGAAGVFSRVFPVFNAPRRDGDYSRPVIDEFKPANRLPDNRVATEGDAAGRFNVRFFPEGGHLVKGVNNRVAFDITTRDGQSVEAAGELIMPDGNRIDVSTMREGRGCFDCIPGEEAATLTLIDGKGREIKSRMPVAENRGCALRVYQEDDSVYVCVSRSKDFDMPLGMLLVKDGRVDAFEVLPGNERLTTLGIVLKDMTAGVNQIALIDEQCNIVAERSIFVYPHKVPDRINISERDSIFAPCDKITLALSSEAEADISVAIRDADTDINGLQGNIATWMLLSSDLHGFIRNPEYYLESDDEEHRRAADLLMMVQGWRRYDIPVMAGKTVWKQVYPMEDGLYVDGRLRKTKQKTRVDSVDIDVTLYNRDGASFVGRCVSDSSGFYAFKIPDCEGEWTMLLNTSRSGKPMKCGIMIDRNFSPVARRLSYYETVRQPLSDNGILLSANKTTEDLHIPIDKRNHLIKEVKVKGHRLLELAREGWENEQRGAYYASVRYDCDKALDEMHDKGEDVPKLLDWLKNINGFFTGSTGSFDHYPLVRYDLETGIRDFVPNIELMRQDFIHNDGMFYKNRPIVWVLDNVFYTISQCPLSVETYIDNSLVKTITDLNLDKDKLKEFNEQKAKREEIGMFFEDLEDYKSVYISEDPIIWRRYIDVKNLEDFDPVTVFLYSHHSMRVKNKGQRKTHFNAYNKPETFEMPDYSVLPPMEDYRRTLYWNPNVKTDKKGRATIELYNNSTCKRLAISAEGMTNDGMPLTFH